MLVPSLHATHGNSMLRAFAALGPLLLVLPLLLLHSGGPAGAGTAPLSRQGVHVIGDSIARGVHKTALDADHRPPRWTVDARGGRRMTALGTWYIPRTNNYWRYVRHIFSINRHRPMRTAVIGLGTNGADEDMAVAEARTYYRNAIRRVRYHGEWRTGPKRVVLVTPWRDPSHAEGTSNPRTGQPYASYQYADKLAVYYRAILHVAREEPYVCVANWRAYARSRPWLFSDGVHPRQHGREAWARIVIRAVDRCGKW